MMSRPLDLARRDGWPGDILTLAGEAATTSLHVRLLWEAATLLFDMHRFDASARVLRELLALVDETARVGAADDDILASHSRATAALTALTAAKGTAGTAGEPARRTLERGSDTAARPAAAKRAPAGAGRVVVAAGHLVDAPGRRDVRFPASKERAVCDRIETQLDAWRTGSGDLAICGGARGADLLFAECCAARGAEVWLMLALALPQFLEASVRLPGTDWEERYRELTARTGVRVFEQPSRLGEPPPGVSPFARNNAWMLDTGRAEVSRADDLHVLMVWDERTAADGPGGTVDFADRVKALGLSAAVINPLRLSLA